MTQETAAGGGSAAPAGEGPGRAREGDARVPEVDAVLPALESELIRLARRARVATRTWAATLHPRLDPAAFPLVMLLAESGGLRMSQVAAQLSLEKSTVTRQVDAATRIGLIERVPDPTDSRARLATLTPAGEERMNRLLADRRRRWLTELHTWDPTDIAELTRLLRRLGHTEVA